MPVPPLLEQTAPLSLSTAWRQHGSLLLRLTLVPLLVNCKPSEAFLSLYLTQPVAEGGKGLTEAQLNEEVWPYDTYGAFALLLPAGYLAEVLGYRSVILLGLLCREATRALLLFGEGVGCMAAMQVAYAAAGAALTVFFAYVLTATAPEVRAAATSSALVAYHAGNVLGSVLGSVLRPLVPLRALFYISWGSTSLGMLCFALLPPSVHAAPPSLASLLRRHGPRAVAAELRELYAPGLVRLWLLWWCLGFAAHHILGNYYQMQLLERATPAQRAAFGYVEAGLEAAMLVGSLGAALAPRAALRRDAAVLGVGGALTAACLLLTLALRSPPGMALAATLNCVAFGALAFQQACGTVAIAAALRGRPRFSVVLTTNTFAALGVAMLAQKVAAAYHAGTSAHYWMAIGAVSLLAVGCAAVHAATPPPKSGAEVEGTERDELDEGEALGQMQSTVASRGSR